LPWKFLNAVESNERYTRAVYWGNKYGASGRPQRWASLTNQSGVLPKAGLKRTPFLQENSPLGKDFLRE